MMHHRGSIIGLLIVVGLLILAGSAIHNAAWNQGFAMGRLSAGGEGTAALPYAYPGAPHAGLGVLLAFGLIVLGAVVIFRRSVRFHLWRAYGQHGMPPWAAGPQAGQSSAQAGQPNPPEGQQGFVPPWWRQWYGQPQGQPGTPEGQPQGFVPPWWRHWYKWAERHGYGPCGPWSWGGPVPPQQQAAPQQPEKPAQGGEDAGNGPQA